MANNLPSGYEIRPARPADATGAAQVHVQAWQECYGSILSPEIIAQRSLEQRIGQREKLYGDRADSLIFLVLTTPGGDVVGFCDATPCAKHQPSGVGEILAIYLLNSASGFGNGRRMMVTAALKLLDQGCQSAIVNVLAANTPARRFYERLGGVVIGEDKCNVALLSDFPSVTYQYTDLTALGTTT
jgi:ribosomal protein S18 acetylase RimI-like enzyme